MDFTLENDIASKPAAVVKLVRKAGGADMVHGLPDRLPTIAQFFIVAIESGNNMHRVRHADSNEQAEHKG